jgi:hypothetical protein
VTSSACTDIHEEKTMKHSSTTSRTTRSTSGRDGKRRYPGRSKQRGKEFGEGNYEATHNYDRAAAAFAKSGAVAPAARAAAPRTKQEAADMAQAEAEGRARSKGEDPALHLENFFVDLTKP